MCLRPSVLQALPKVGEIARAVIGHDALHLDAEAGVVGDGRFEEGDGALFPLVLHHSAEGDARGIVDADMDELPADTEMAVDDTGATSVMRCPTEPICRAF